MRYVFGLCLVVAGCANPLEQMDRLSEVEVASPSLEVVSNAEPAEKPAEAAPAKGLFGGLFSANPNASGAVRAKPASRSRNALAMADVPVGTRLPYGQIARVCDVTKKTLGRQIERAAGYKLFDSNPQSTAPRTFYVTGFSDGCARQFTAALVLVGTPSRHEELRYGQPSDLYPYSRIDRTYEQIKSRVCAVPKGRPCGSRIKQMERDTIFLSTYERFSNNARWADILIHDGDVVAKDIKS